MKIKDGVITQITKIVNGAEQVIKPSPQIVTAWTIADEVSKKHTGKHITITSILDGKHKTGSKHYTGEAFDIRTFIYTPAQINNLTNVLKLTLGKSYDVIFEGDHIHIEYDPK